MERLGLSHSLWWSRCTKRMIGIMAKPNPTLKFGGAVVLATAAFLGLFWLLFWRV
jgi:hypothetical protein